MQTWGVAAFVIVVMSAVNTLLCKWNQLSGEDMDETLALFSIVVSGVISLVCLAFMPQKTRACLAKMNWKSFGSVLGLALTTSLSWFFWVRALRTAPNPGVVNAVCNVDALLVVLLSALVFGSVITKRVILGAVIITVGLWMVVR